jgi:integrase
MIADMTKLQRLTGCRPGEICALRQGEADRTGDVWIFQLKDHRRIGLSGSSANVHLTLSSAVLSLLHRRVRGLFL